MNSPLRKTLRAAFFLLKDMSLSYFPVDLSALQFLLLCIPVRKIIRLAGDTFHPMPETLPTTQCYTHHILRSLHIDPAQYKLFFVSK